MFALGAGLKDHKKDNKMSEVIVVYELVSTDPTSVEKAQELEEKVKGIEITGEGNDSSDQVQQYYAKLGKTEIKDGPFGIKKVACTFEIPDASGVQDALENALKALDCVEADSVECTFAGRPV